MKKIFASLLCLLTIGAITTVGYAQNEGTDLFGYSWKNNQASGGPTYSWIDISDGTLLTGLADDNFVGPIPMGIDFKYYWLNYNSLYIGTNGYVMFGQGMNVASGTGGFPEFPVPGGSSSPNNYIGLFLSDLTTTDFFHNTTPGCAIRYKKVDSKFVVTFENIPFWVRETEVSSGYRGKSTYQIVLDASDNSIVINYKSREGEVSESYQGPNTVFLSGGMENITGNLGSQFFKNVYPANNSCIKVTYPDNPTYVYKDVQVEWVNEEGNYGLTACQNGAPIYVKASVKNSGTKEVVAGTDLVYVYRRVFDDTDGGSESSSLRDTVIIADGLVSGATKVVSFTKPIPPSKKGTFRVLVQTKLSGDQYPANNTVNGEVIVVDTTQTTTRLGYDQFLFFGVGTWAPGDGTSAGLEVGMRITPPFYPFSIEKVIYGTIIGQNGAEPDTLLPIRGTMVDDDGPNAGPGTKLKEFTISVDTIKALYDQESTDPIRLELSQTINPPINITSGSVYVSWDREDSADTLVNARAFNLLMSDVGEVKPNSFRSYEINGGVWASYRERNSTDFCIWIEGKKTVVGVEEKMNALASNITLYPNPSDGAATLAYTLKERTSVRLVVRNMLGQEVFNRDLGTQVAGPQRCDFAQESFPASGVYSYTLYTGGSSTSGKLVISR